MQSEASTRNHNSQEDSADGKQNKYIPKFHFDSESINIHEAQAKLIYQYTDVKNPTTYFKHIA